MGELGERELTTRNTVEDSAETQKGDAPPIDTIIPNLGEWSIGAVVNHEATALSDPANSQIEMTASTAPRIGGHNS